MNMQLSRVSAFARENGFTEPQVRWWIFQASTNGLAEAGALVRIGRAVFIRADKFAEWIEAQQAKAA